MRVVSPHPRELTLADEALAFTSHVPAGFSLAPHMVKLNWYVRDSVDDYLGRGWTMLDQRPPTIIIHVLANRLRSEREIALLKTLWHEYRHAWQVLTWPGLLEERTKDEIESDAEDFAWRAVAAWEEHQARWQRLLLRGAAR